jgi:hypothetical protein
VHRIHHCGISTSGKKPQKKSNTDNRIVLATIPDLNNQSSSQSRSQKGVKGLTQKAKYQIKDSLTILAKEFGINHLTWLVITYNHIELKAIQNLAKNVERLRKKLTYCLNKTSLPYVVTLGIQERYSHSFNCPCYDINICLPDSFIRDKLIKDIYRVLSSIALTDVNIPYDLYCENINNTWDDFPCFLEYFVKQVANNSIAWMQSLSYPIPKTWYFIPDSLREKTQIHIEEFTDKSLYDVKAIETSLNHTIVTCNSQKLVSMTNDLENHHPYQVIEKVKEMLTSSNSLQ